jgi:hypothetical protein
MAFFLVTAMKTSNPTSAGLLMMSLKLAYYQNFSMERRYQTGIG